MTDQLSPEREAELLVEIDQLRGEVAALIEEKAAAFVDRTTMLRNMEIRDGVIEMSIEPAREILLTWCAAVRVVLDDCGAENYAEIDVEMPRQSSVSLDVQDGQHPTDSYTLTLQRRWARTPHQLRRQAECDRNEARAEVERLRAELEQRNEPLLECPECGRTDVSLTKAGRVRSHSGNEWVGRFRQVCKGVGELPRASQRPAPAEGGADV